MRAALMLAAFLLCCLVPADSARAERINRVWCMATDFVDGHSYATQVETGVSGTASITLAKQAYFAPDPHADQGAIGGYWANNPSDKADWLIRLNDPAGDNRWSREYNGEPQDNDYANGVAFTPSGGAVVAGMEDMSKRQRGRNWRVRSYDTTGGLLWSVDYDDPGSDPANANDEALGVAVDGTGNAIVAGYETRVDLDEQENWLIRKYSPTGGLVWSIPFNSSAPSGFTRNDRATGVAVDATGDAYVVGYEQRDDLGQGFNWRVNKYDGATGNPVPLWTAEYDSPSSGNDKATAVAVDSAAGAIYVAGYEDRSDTIPNQGTNLVLNKYSTGGTLTWSVSMVTFAGTWFTSSEEANAVAVDPVDGSVVVAGGIYDSDMNTDWDWLVAKYDNLGNLLWSKSHTGYGSQDDSALGVAIDGTGNITVVGYEKNDRPEQQQNWRMIKYTPAGAVIWSQDYNSPALNSYDYARAVAVNPAGDSVVAGYWNRGDLTALPGLPIFVQKHDAVTVGDWIYVIGGEINPTWDKCDAKGGQPVRSAKVYFTKVAPDGSLGTWKKAAYLFGDTGPAASLWGPPQLPTAGRVIQYHKSVAVNNRIYVSGGQGQNVVEGKIVNLNSTIDVMSASVDPVSGETSPWRSEPTLPKPLAQHGMVYAAGSLFVLGGYSTVTSAGLGTSNQPSRDIFRSDIRPDGALSEWEYVGKIAQSDDMDPTSCFGPSSKCMDSGCSGCGVSCLESCCRSQDQCFGWVSIYPIAAMRTIGFIGGVLRPDTADNLNCLQSESCYYMTLGDNNRPTAEGWHAMGGDNGKWGSSILARNGSLLMVGGYHGGMLCQTTFNYVDPVAGSCPRGLIRTGPGDQENLRLAIPDGTELYTSGIGMPTCNDKFSNKMKPGDTPLVSAGEYVYLIGGAMQNGYCNAVMRSMMKTSTWYVDAGSLVTRPYDLGALYRMTRIAWTFEKTGPGKTDDWAMFRYRVAGEDMAWTAWSPRIPEEGSMPADPGVYTYASDAKSVFMREPAAPNPFRYLQFEVSLYNNPANDVPSSTIPRFLECRVEGESLAVSIASATRVLDFYPVPARDKLTVRYQIAPEGAELTVKIYNVAGNLVAAYDYSYPAGSETDRREIIDVSRFSQGVYVGLVSARSLSGGPGLSFWGQTYKMVKGKFVIRR